MSKFCNVSKYVSTKVSEVRSQTDGPERDRSVRRGHGRTV